MSEGGESAMFKHLFKSWKEAGQIQGLGKTHAVGKIGNLLIPHYSFYMRVQVRQFWVCIDFVCTCAAAKVDQVKFDVMELHAQPKLAAQERMVDDASGEVQV